ncbi:MAG: alpha-L-fucosidase [Clostridia bacterium]
MKTIKEYLDIVDEVISNGKFKDDWQSLSAFEMPKWYQKGRFGLFIHWGCYSLPATESEWYPRLMYIKGTKSWKHRRKTYGKNWDYRQIVEQFNPSNFNAQEWVELFKQSGAKYIMPVAEHHDGVKMYASELNKWNMMDLRGRDYISELKHAAEENDIGFLTSNHRAEHYWFLNGARKFCPQSEVTKNLYPDLYGPAVLPDNKNVFGDLTLTITQEWLEDWLASSCEMIDKLQPLAVYFDWWIYMDQFKPYIKKFLAYYYNRAIEWNKEVGVFYKYGSIMKGCAIFDVERGQIDSISSQLWQNDTAIAKNSWGYTQGNEFKSPKDILKNLIDVVSKNGCFMLNVGPKADGTICEEEKNVLLAIGQWLSTNGEAIYDSKPFDVFGEGVKSQNGTFKENLQYKKGDYRFTFQAGAIYVFPMFDKPTKKFVINSLRFANEGGIRYNIQNVSILGREEEVKFVQSKENLTLTLDDEISSDLPFCFKIAVD